MDYRDIGILAASEAAEIIRTRYLQPFERLEKKHLDFATDADVAVERRVVEMLTGAFPDHAIFAEEQGWAGAGPAAEHVWMVDPLCGTLNFAAGIPLFCVNLALYENKQPLLAVIAEPLEGGILWAVRGEGAYRRRPDGLDEPLQPNATSRLIDVDYDSNPSGATVSRAQSLIREAILQHRFSARLMSTSLSLPYVAEGRLAASVHFQMGPDNRPDSLVHFAAGVLLCREAGCVVTDVDGRPWDEKSEHLLVAADSQTHLAVRELVQAGPRARYGPA